MDTRCDRGKRLHCPHETATGFGSRSGAPFQVTREVEPDGACRVRFCDLYDGPTTLGIRCDGESLPSLHALHQLHMSER